MKKPMIFSDETGPTHFTFANLLLWQSRRQTLTALSAPEAEVVALSETCR